MNDHFPAPTKTAVEGFQGVTNSPDTRELTPGKRNSFVQFASDDSCAATISLNMLRDTREIAFNLRPHRSGLVCYRLSHPGFIIPKLYPRDWRRKDLSTIISFCLSMSRPSDKKKIEIYIFLYYAMRIGASMTVICVFRL